MKSRSLTVNVAMSGSCFVYFRMYYSGGCWHKPQNSHAALLDKYWSKLQIGSMTREELKKVSVDCFHFPPRCVLKKISFSLKKNSLFVGAHQQVSQADGGV